MTTITNFYNLITKHYMMTLTMVLSVVYSSFFTIITQWTLSYAMVGFFIFGTALFYKKENDEYATQKAIYRIKKLSEELSELNKKTRDNTTL